MVLATFQKLLNIVGNLGKIIVATGFKRLPKVQKFAQSGHTGPKLDEMLMWLTDIGDDDIETELKK